MMIQEGQTLNDRYVIKSLIGQGGMSFVYRAEDRKMGRTVALKVLKEEYCEDEEFIRKFQNEAQAAAKLNHPNIVAAYDVVDHDDLKLHYIVMELVDGITLKNYIQRKGRLSSRETIRIALQVVSGMEQAHKMGIVHRDIKPQNIMVSADGSVKVADFGIARAATQQTVNATVMGSVHYISPEQARSGIADERSDIYSFGCTIYEMLTGQVPYDGDTSVSVVFAHLENRIPHVRDLVPDVYPALDLAVYKCMQKKADRRYQHIDKLGDDLECALKDPSGSFMHDAAPEELGETRVLSEKELTELKERKSRKKAHSRESDPDSNAVKANISVLYRGIALVCIIFIVILLFVIGRNIYTFLHAGQNLDAPTAAVTTAEVSTAEVNITISALDNHLQDIIGSSIEEAEKDLSEYDIHLVPEKEEFSDRYNEGLIIGYHDGNYENGDTIKVTLSKGPLTIVFYDPQHPENLDNLHSIEIHDLEKQLQERGIKDYSIKEEYSASVPAGNVIRTNKPDSSGTDKLEITVSKGLDETKTVVPSLLQKTEEDAVRALKTAGLYAGDIRYAPSDTVPEGNVSHQDIDAGTVVDQADQISFTVSSGPNGESRVKSASGNDSGKEGNDDHWYSSVNQAVMLGSGLTGPGTQETMLVSIRLRQDVNGEERYTTLQQPRSYEMGTELQVVFSSIKGEPNVPLGVVEVVDASSDTVLYSFNCVFQPR